MAETAQAPTQTQSKKDEKLAASLDDDVRFKFGPPLIQTFEDAVQAYLREEISEEELKAAEGKYGMSYEHYRFPVGRQERPDAAFQRELPDHLFQNESYDVPDAEERVKLAQEKEDARKAATDAAAKVVKDVKPETDLATLQNEASAEAVAKKEEAAAKKEGGDTKTT